MSDVLLWVIAGEVTLLVILALRNEWTRLRGAWRRYFGTEP